VEIHKHWLVINTDEDYTVAGFDQLGNAKERARQEAQKCPGDNIVVYESIYTVRIREMEEREL